MIRSLPLPVSGAALALFMAGPAVLGAQTPQPRDSAAAQAQDSLTERLERAERAIERLQRQIEEQSQAKVQSRLRNRVELSGLILLNGFYNDVQVNNADGAQYVVAPDTTGLPNGALGATVRQSRIGLAVSGAHALGAQLSGELQLDFAGGQQPSSGGRTFPTPRIRTAFAKLDWRHLGLLVGQETQIISPLNPVSFAAIGTPEFTAAGNLWFWVPQVRLTYETGARPRLGLQAAALAPMGGTPQPAFGTVADTAERSRRPMLQGRAYIGWGDGDAESQIGVGIHRGWFATIGDSLLTSQAYTADLRLAFGEKVQLLAEGYYNGSALAGLGGGGVGQSFGVAHVPVDSRGGWAQLNLRPTFSWELGGGLGMDDPDDSDLPSAGRLKNMIYEGHLHWRPGGGLIVGAAFRRIETTYSTGVRAANVVAFFSGVAF
jgi:hypothetical protein